MALKSALIQLTVNVNVDGVTPLPVGHPDPTHVSGNLWDLGAVDDFGSLLLEQLLRNKQVLGDAEAAVITRLRAVGGAWVAGAAAVIGGVGAGFDQNLTFPQNMPLEATPANLLTVLSPSAGWRVRNGQPGPVVLLFEIVGGQLAEVMCCATDATIGALGGDVVVDGAQLEIGIPPLRSVIVPLTVAGALQIGFNNTYDSSGAGFGVSLAVGIPGQRVGLKNTGGSANACTVTPAAGTIENIAGAQGATAVIASATAAVMWELGDDGNWWLLWRT
jgi:hypothetical protein